MNPQASSLYSSHEIRCCLEECLVSTSAIGAALWLVSPAAETLLASAGDPLSLSRDFFNQESLVIGASRLSQLPTGTYQYAIAVDLGLVLSLDFDHKPELKESLPVFEIVRLALERAAQQEAAMEFLHLALEGRDDEVFLKQFLRICRRILGARAAFAWLSDRVTARFGLVASTLDEEVAKHELPVGVASAFAESSVATPTYDYPSPENTTRLVVALRAFGGLVGFIEVQFAIPLNTGHRELMARLGEEGSKVLEGIRKSNAIQIMSETWADFAEAKDVNDLDTKLLWGAFRIVGCEIGSVLNLHHETGRLDIGNYHPRKGRYAPKEITLSVDTGVTGESLKSLKQIRIGDVRDRKPFKEFWPDMRSELSTPLYVPKVGVRLPTTKGSDNSQVSEGIRRIGVLNLESPLPNAFSEFDAECVERLTKGVAIMRDRLEFDETLRKAHDAESTLAKNLAGSMDWQDIVKSVGDQIRETLSYTHVNISLVSPDGKRIRSEHVWLDRLSPSAATPETFKKLSDYDVEALNSIQADVVRRQVIEVPEPSDQRLDPRLQKEFGLDRLVLVYLPMMMGDIVVGTIEAGYGRKFRQYIFEQDLQILRVLTDYVAAAVWKRRHGQLDVLRHEIAQSAKGIIENAGFLKRNWQILSPEKINWKLDDLRSEGEVVESLLDKLVYYTTDNTRATLLERSNVGSDILIRLIYQLNSDLRHIGQDLSCIEYSADALKRIHADVDRVKLSEVFNNVLRNAIKYRRSSESLRISISVEVRSKRYVVRVSDNGIGIDHGFENRIFDKGIRAPTAISQAVGSGLGLWLARQYMRDMGGEIELECPRDPTTFRVILRRD